MLLYRIYAERLYNEDVGNYLSYGISLYEIIGHEYVLLDEISDVSLDYMKMRSLEQKMNAGQASYLHFCEIVEDFIG